MLACVVRTELTTYKEVILGGIDISVLLQFSPSHKNCRGTHGSPFQSILFNPYLASMFFIAATCMKKSLNDVNN